MREGEGALANKLRNEVHEVPREVHLRLAGRHHSEAMRRAQDLLRAALRVEL